MRRVKVINVANQVQHLDTGEILKEVNFQCVEGASTKHFSFWGTDEQIEAMGERLLEIAGVEYEDDPPAPEEPDVPTGPGARLLKDKEPENLHRALGKFGCKDHYALASEVMNRPIATFTSLTVKSAVMIYEVALERYGTEQQQEEYAQRQERAAA